MRRLFALIAVCLLMAGVLVLPASAESAASKVDLRATITSEGDCLATMTVTLRLETPPQGLQFPLPANAKGITLNGVNANTTKTSSATLVDISRMTNDSVGEYSLMFDYTIPEAVKVNAEAVNGTAESIVGKREYPLQLTLPLLSGFDMPVESLNFVITMPGTLKTEDPKFTSIYRQESIESDLNILPISGSQIIGSSKVVLNDHEGVTMTMLVSEEMFPTVSTYVREGNPELPYIIGFGVLALVYWLLFLRALPMRRSHASTAPEGITAGELGCRLTLSGGDLTMMVFSWAQLGYILIHMDGNGRVILHKRMDMGNERNQFENKVFRSLFGNRRMVDATGLQYARLCRKVAGLVPSERSMNKGSSGNVKLFRGIACISQLCCGICVAMNMSIIPALQIIMAIILAVIGLVSAWLIQEIAYRTHLRGKTAVLIGFVCILLWIVLGIFCGQVWIPLGCCVGQFLVGYLAAYGGRRSDLGRHDASQVLGLRSYLKKLQPTDLNRLMKNDPDYFFNMAPYALALGIINPFSRAFGRRKLDQCPYIVSRVSGKRTADEWGQLMADVADLMDVRARQMQIEQAVSLPDIHFDFHFERKSEKKPAPKKKQPASKKQESSGKQASSRKKQPPKK